MNFFQQIFADAMEGSEGLSLPVQTTKGKKDKILRAIKALDECDRPDLILSLVETKLYETSLSEFLSWLCEMKGDASKIIAKYCEKKPRREIDLRSLEKSKMEVLSKSKELLTLLPDDFNTKVDIFESMMDQTIWILTLSVNDLTKLERFSYSTRFDMADNSIYGKLLAMAECSDNVKNRALSNGRTMRGVQELLFLGFPVNEHVFHNFRNAPAQTFLKITHPSSESLKKEFLDNFDCFEIPIDVNSPKHFATSSLKAALKLSQPREVKSFECAICFSEVTSFYAFRCDKQGDKAPLYCISCGLGNGEKCPTKCPDAKLIVI
jgi:hypothetical protein